jgi:hypothetical protein
VPKALEVTVDGKIVGICVPQKGMPISVFVGNIPKTYMRMQCISASQHENWHWQLVDVKEDQIVSFRLIETVEAGLRPRIVIHDAHMLPKP